MAGEPAYRPAMTTDAEVSGMNDFDFYTGTWDVTNRRRADFMEHSCFTEEATDWEEFPAVTVASRHLDGLASFDEIEFPTKGMRGSRCASSLPSARNGRCPGSASPRAC